MASSQGGRSWKDADKKCECDSSRVLGGSLILVSLLGRHLFVIPPSAGSPTLGGSTALNVSRAHEDNKADYTTFISPLYSLPFLPPDRSADQRQALEAVMHKQHRHQHQSQDNGEERSHSYLQKLEIMRHRLQKIQTRNHTILREVDEAKALVQEYREQQHNNAHNNNDEDDDNTDSSNCRQRLVAAKKSFIRVVKEDMGMLPALCPEKMLMWSVTGAGVEERQQQQQQQGRRQSINENGLSPNQGNETEERPVAHRSPHVMSSNILWSEEGEEEEEEEEEDEEKEEKEEVRWDDTSSATAPSPPTSCHVQGCQQFLTPASDFYIAKKAATRLQHAPQQQRKSLLLPEWGTQQIAKENEGGFITIRYDIRDMTSKERLAIVTHIIKRIESLAGGGGSGGSGGSGVVFSTSTSSISPSQPRLGYPRKWDGRIPRAVLELEGALYQYLKIGQALHPSLPLPTPPQQHQQPQLQQKQQQQQLHCLALLHTLHFSARELLPLDLLNGEVSEAKVAKYHRRIRRAAGMWVAFRRHLRFLQCQNVLTSVEMRSVFGDALLGDMSKRERGEILRLRGKVDLLLESMMKAFSEELQEEQREREKEKNKEKSIGAVDQHLDEQGTTTTRKGISSTSSSSSSRSSTLAAATCPGKKSFLSRVLRW